MNCLVCGSDKIKLIGRSYPESYECLKCKHTFVKTPQALIDE